ncbi:Retrovirus-related Pol polyprotein from transposon TNT 1-94, partial [Linum grandiflorum]
MAIADLEETEEKETAKITSSSTASASTEVCLQTLLEDAEWVLDSGCSHHMTGNKNLFYTFQSKERGKVSFGDNRSSKILGFGEIGEKDNIILKKVMLVEKLKHNLISISQLCGDSIFESNKCSVERVKDNQTIF